MVRRFQRCVKSNLHDARGFAACGRPCQLRDGGTTPGSAADNRRSSRFSSIATENRTIFRAPSTAKPLPSHHLAVPSKRVCRKRHALPAQGAAKVCGEVNGGRWPAPGRDLMNGLPELADGSGRRAGPAYVVMFHLGLFSRPDGLQVARKLTLMTIDLGQPFGHGDDIGLRIGHIWRLVIGHQRKPSSAAFCHMLTLARFA